MPLSWGLDSSPKLFCTWMAGLPISLPLSYNLSFFLHGRTTVAYACNSSWDSCVSSSSSKGEGSNGIKITEPSESLGAEVKSRVASGVASSQIVRDHHGPLKIVRYPSRPHIQMKTRAQLWLPSSQAFPNSSPMHFSTATVLCKLNRKWETYMASSGQYYPTWAAELQLNPQPSVRIVGALNWAQWL